jgi:hypothetical protein
MAGSNGRSASSRSGNATATRRPAKAVVTKLGPPDGQDAAADGAALARVKAGADEIAARELQAASEGLTPVNSVELKGRRFRVGPVIGGMALMKFAASADSGLNTLDFAALAAMHNLLRSCFEVTPPCGECDMCLAQPDALYPVGCEVHDPGDWPRFEQHALRTKASPDDLFESVQQAMQVIGARPTRQP